MHGEIQSCFQRRVCFPARRASAAFSLSSCSADSLFALRTARRAFVTCSRRVFRNRKSSGNRVDFALRTPPPLSLRCVYYCPAGKLQLLRAHQRYACVGDGLKKRLKLFGCAGVGDEIIISACTPCSEKVGRVGLPRAYKMHASGTRRVRRNCQLAKLAKHVDCFLLSCAWCGNAKRISHTRANCKHRRFVSENQIHTGGKNKMNQIPYC